MSSNPYRSANGVNKLRCPKIGIGTISDAVMMTSAGHVTTIEVIDLAAIETTGTSRPEIETSLRFAFVTLLSKPHGVILVESNVTTGVRPTTT